MTAQQQIDAAVNALTNRYPALGELIAAARDILAGAFPGAAEEVDAKAGIIGYSLGPGYRGVVATLILSKKGVKIGIPYGATLNDPEHLLEGAGKVHRHISITTVASLSQPAVKQLLAETFLAWQRRTSGT